MLSMVDCGLVETISSEVVNDTTFSTLVPWIPVSLVTSGRVASWLPVLLAPVGVEVSWLVGLVGPVVGEVPWFSLRGWS